jgi:penicillin amidase
MTIVKYSFLSILLALVILWFGGQYYLSGSVAKYHGEVDLTNLGRAVEVTFDAKGIPQIWAKSNGDMYLALGYLQASERLFQMELIRRVSYGELAEMIGSAGISYDETVRRLGFAAKAKSELSAVNPSTMAILEQFTSGINQWIEHTHVLPPEFELLGLKPNAWTAENILTVAIYQTWFSHALMDKDSTYATLMASLGSDIEAKLTGFKSWSPTTVSNSFIEKYFQGDAFPLRGTKASNSWVVSPQKSQSGKAVHSSDPHLQVSSVPNFWYIAGLHSEEGSNFVGITFPGLPVALMGHTDSIAYAFTVASIDLNDSFSVKKDGNSHVSLFGQREALRVRDELILVNGAEATTVKIKETNLGPVIAESDSDYTILHWAGYDFNYGHVLNQMTKLVTATNFDTFRDAVTQFGSLDVNWTYSDIRGNIGYQLGAPIPRRESQNTYSVQSANDTRAIWRGYYPLDSVPFSYNPHEQFITSNNNQIVPENFPVPVPGFYDPYRVVRAKELLSEDRKFSAADMTAFQLDRISILARHWQADLADAAEKLGKPELAKRFRTWDGKLTLDSDLPSILTAWWYYIPKFIAEDDLGSRWRMLSSVVEELLQELDHPMYDNRITEKIETRGDIIAECLAFVLEHYEGKNFEDVQQFEIKHPFTLSDDFRSEFLDLYLGLNRGPYGFPSDLSTLNVAISKKRKNQQGFSVEVAASMRYVLDWSDIDGFTIYTNLGQSGNPFSPHYDDFLSDWLNGQPWTVPFSKKLVYEKRQSLLKLF